MHVKDIWMIVCLGVLKIDFCKFQDTGQKDNQRAPVSFRDVVVFAKFVNHLKILLAACSLLKVGSGGLEVFSRLE